MLVGIIADTHNELDLTQEALNIFKERGVDFIIHAGDMTSPQMLTIFEGFTFKGVLGGGGLGFGGERARVRGPNSRYV
ncbi:MAG: metallophosphoesterase family protein, partial [Bacteroidales bacterium]|nr:metallophosphoesterase family protein [Bacteroidales bacterium]